MPIFLKGAGRQSRTQAESIEQHQLLAGAEDGLVIGAVRLGPEFQHAALRVKGLRDNPHFL